MLGKSDGNYVASSRFITTTLIGQLALNNANKWDECVTQNTVKIKFSQKSSTTRKMHFNTTLRPRPFKALTPV